MRSPIGACTVKGADGTPLFCEQAGVGAPVVLLNGLACDGFIWKYLFPELARRYRMIHWHYPGHGLSGIPRESASFTIARLADDLHCVLRQIEAPPAVLVGHSLGVQVALETWHRYPRSVQGLVLICGVSGRLMSSVDRSALFRYLLPLFTLTESVSPAFLWDLFKRLPSRILSLAAILSQEINIRLIRRPDLDAYFNGIKSADIRVVLRFLKNADIHDASAYLGDIDVPTLVFGGGLDKLTPLLRVQALAGAIPDAELHVAERGSHALPVEQPDLVTLRTRRFLEERVFPSGE